MVYAPPCSHHQQGYRRRRRHRGQWQIQGDRWVRMNPFASPVSVYFYRL